MCVCLRVYVCACDLCACVCVCVCVCVEGSLLGAICAWVGSLDEFSHVRCLMTQLAISSKSKLLDTWEQTHTCTHAHIPGKENHCI